MPRSSKVSVLRDFCGSRAISTAATDAGTGRAFETATAAHTCRLTLAVCLAGTSLVMWAVVAAIAATHAETEHTDSQQP